MSKNKTKLCLLFGGANTEHEVSVRTAKSVYQALDPDKYQITLIGIDKKGNWLQLPTQDLLQIKNNKAITAAKPIKVIAIKDVKKPLQFQNTEIFTSFDIVFPLMHGTGGEDGMIQGFLQTLGIPYVGADVLGSAVGMNKIATKMILLANNIKVADFVWTNKTEISDDFINQSVKKLGFPMFIKPANQGSSVGISKVRDQGKLKSAIDEALQYDSQVLFEKAIVGRELEVAVLGNEHPQASVVGEIIPQGHEFYDYDAKYLDENGAKLEIPAKMSTDVSEKIRQTALKAFRVLQCKGMARVDFFLTANNEILVNEINTIPGFTSISMYPKLWEASGLSYSKLLDKLIELAIA